MGALLGLLVHIQTHASWRDSMIFSLPLGVLATPLSLSAGYMCRALPLSRGTAARVATTALAAALVTASLWALVGRAWWSLLGQVGVGGDAASVPAVVVLQTGLGMLAYTLAVTVQYLMQAVEDSTAATTRALRSEVAQRDAELRALRAQVDPHFLFNSLNSIAALVSANPDEARRMCQMLADFLRDSLALGGSTRIPLGREIALAEQYLGVEQVRFGRRLSVRTSVEPDSTAVPVPPLILQPLVENAVRHGIATCLEGGVVEIGARRVGDRAVIAVANPRDPMGGRRGSGMGLDLVRRRLAAAFGDRAALAVEAEPASYRVSLTVPIDEGAGA